ncbi:histidine phosphatase superfamily [Dunaliella salina]|uniref:Histidine phosphatase superfamily n=1 Tax=Dunaliella salina TaxID=3046 RepID=A0ABQ7G3T7_DUNSA|nr:histidine phosphatase superfamily [Dunaliella salina]|eukprot:KAF5829265.1 histidine phosphatase superfamily [Dunaliella salina]
MTLEMHRRHVVRYLLALVCIMVVASLLVSRERHQRTPLHIHQDGSRPHGKELLLVQAVFRHGARTPLAEMYFTDTRWSHCGPNEGVKLALQDENGSKSSPPPPIIDKVSAARHPANLTPAGAQPYHLLLEHSLATSIIRFVGELGFLSPDFKVEEVSLRTTCIARTGATLQGVLTGLWPDAAALDAPPIPVNASLEAYEIEYGKTQTCPLLGPKLASLQAKVADRDAKDPHAIAYAAKVAKRLNLTCRLKLTTAALSWIRLHDVLAAMIAEGLPLPDGADKKLAKEVADQAIMRESAVIAPIPEQKFLPKEECQQVIRMSIGPMLQRLVDNMR